MPRTAAAPLDALSTPYDTVGGVDLLLHEIDAHAPPSASAAERTIHRAAVAAIGSGTGRAVLVVDGSAIARKFLARKLQALDYEVLLAEDGEQALEMIEQQAFAVVFLEIALASQGGLDGLRLCRAIKQKPDHPEGIAPAVVMVTGHTGSADRVRASLAGCDAYLTKPLLKDEFLATLTEVDPLFKP